MEQHGPVRNICVQEWLSLWASLRCSPSRQCPLSPQLLSRAHSCLNTQQSVHSNTEGGRKHVSEVWCHLRGQWDWTDALTAEAGSSHSGLYTDTAEVEPRACIPHWVRAVLTQHIQVPQGCSAGPSEAAAVLLLQLGWLTRLSCQGNCQSHAQPRETGLSWKHPQHHVHSNCTQKLPLDLKADFPHQQPHFLSDIASFQQSHILLLSEQLLPIFTTHFRRQTHTSFSCVVWWENRGAISKCL